MSAASGPIHVLHVDDEPDFASTAATFIEQQDERFAVETVTSTAEAHDRLAASRVDCIVSDFDMPGQTGLEFLEAVRADHPDLPFILYTGKGSEEVASEAISAGVTEYLQKERGTSQYEVLANRILNAVERHRTQRELEDRERRLNLFFEQSPLGVIRWDDAFNFARVNDAAREILGYAEGELEGQPWDVVIPEADREEIEDAVVTDLLDDEGGYHSINENVRKDGERIVCEWHNWVVTDDADDVVAVFSQFQDITERIERERELGDLERYNREIVENAPVGLFRLDEEMRITYENRRAEEIVGVPEGEDGSPALGRDLRELPSVEETGAVDALNRLEAGETVSFDTRFESIFGKESYLIGQGVPLFDDGAFDGAIIMVVDITERKEAERLLEQLRQHITDVVWMTSPAKDSMDFISDSYEDLTGRSVASLREDPLSFVDAIHPEDRERVRAALEEQRRDPDAYEETYRIVRPDGEQRWVHDRSAGVYEDGDLTRIVGIASDITARKEAERELRDQTRQFQGVLDSVDAAIWIRDPGSRFELINRNFRDLFGIDEEVPIEGLTPADILDEEVAAQFRENDRRAIEAAERIEFEETVETAAGTKHFRTSITPMYAEGELVGTCGIATDITDLTRSQHEVERVNDRLERIVGIMSHDLRSPLAVAAGRLELAESTGDSEHLAVVARALDRMGTLIEDLLTLAREGDRVGDLASVELAGLVATSWEVVDTAGATLESETDRTVEADESRLRQLLENLFRNAIDHAGEDVTVRVGDLEGGFFVEDDGPGIPPADRDAVFEAGYSTADGGTGFGLTIVKQVAEAHGWTVRACEGRDGGARFEITDVGSS